MKFAVIALSLLLALGSGCAATTVPGQQGDETIDRRIAECFRIDGVNNWRVIDKRQLIVYGPGRNDAWHLTLFANCEGLDFTEVLAGFSSKARVVFSMALSSVRICMVGPEY